MPYRSPYGSETKDVSCKEPGGIVLLSLEPADSPEMVLHPPAWQSRLAVCLVRRNGAQRGWRKNILR